jgi:hypothetical protein
MTSEHPSFYELDRHCCGVGAAATEVHVASCPRCAEYVASYAPATTVPAWIQSPPRPQRAGRTAWVLGASLAAALTLAVLAQREPAPPYVGVKGGPSVSVFVQHEGMVSLWDGRVLSAGDRVRLEVRPEGFDHVSVFSPSGDGETLERLYAGRVTAQGPLRLPTAWQLDDQGDADVLIVVLSRAEVSPSAARALLRAPERSEVWLSTLRLPKRNGS